MELLANIPLIGGLLSTVVPFVVVLAIVVAVHEYGHYIVARWCGIRSEVFSIGFGPVIWSRRDRRGTLWQVAALPLGGYVKFLGDADGSSRADQVSLEGLSREERARSFHGASVWRRMLTVLAGPFANFVLTAAVFTGVALWQGVPTERPTIGGFTALPGIEQPLRVGDVVLAVNGREVAGFEDIYAAAAAMPEPGPMDFRVEREGRSLDVTAPYAFPPLVDGVEPLSPASEAGLRPGDLVLSAGGRELRSFSDLRDVVLASEGKAIPLSIWRDGAETTLEITPAERDTQDGEGGFERRVMIGVAGAPLYEPATRTPAPWTALGFGVTRVYEVIAQSLNGMRSILNGTIGAENLQGPIGIAQVSGETASQGGLSFIVLIGVISTAIGLLNLFPIPVLDGGHFVAFLIEAVRGRPPSPAVMQLAMSIGLGLILLLMVFATYNDIMRMVS
ncbi:RIP metalloprotease RseP [Amaricoccus solimangrovi]|uniref:Zinc metalloprotease n=1 Tax=Amaricoccus solimangrovi TaxID=2589815 RepID=A0A501WYA9_9RHOB|nr:RIP metalloprotease RseP [Amaricoccus solimangrovi]TPE53560.1 RIP metalloprotease RseP [Amaricoccus solimangrovi]